MKKWAKSERPILVRRVRDILGMTQAEMARALRVSVRAVQSYEQGWRTLPAPLAVQLLTLLAVYKGHAKGGQPCWTQTGCPPEIRRNCPSFRIAGGRFCWLIAGDACGGRLQPSPDTAPRCLSCAVTARLAGP